MGKIAAGYAKSCNLKLTFSCNLFPVAGAHLLGARDVLICLVPYVILAVLFLLVLVRYVKKRCALVFRTGGFIHKNNFNS